MKQDEKRIRKIFYILGIFPIVWIALLLAPYTKGGLIEIIKNGSIALNDPFKIVIVENSIRTIFIILIIYIFSILLYESTRKNYRRREENGSAKWGNAKELNKKYKQPNNYNKILTKNVSVGLNGKKHRRNVNVLVIGGSGAGKTFSYCKPNVMQCTSSYVILDPKGEIVRDTGYLLENSGYEVRVLDLINMEKSHCYNPFVYIKTDNDVQKLVTNLFKSQHQREAYK